jgi:hypothetical protein
MRNLLYPVKGTDVVKSVDAGRQPAVEAEDLVIDQGRERKVIEEVREILPDIGVAVLAEALVVEAVYLGDLTGFVIAPENGDALGISYLQGDK